MAIYRAAAVWAMVAAMAGCTAGPVATTKLAGPDKAAIAGRVAEAKEMLDEGDTYAAIEKISSEDDPIVAANAFARVAGDAYWKDKDLATSVAMHRAGIQYCLAASRRVAGSDPKLSKRLRGGAKMLAYNLSSFTWPGWDEPGIEITSADRAVGADAARCNMRLAVELGVDHGPMGNAHWLVGAWQLAEGKHAEAIASFERCTVEAKQAGDRAAELMAGGFVGVAKILGGADTAGGRKQVAEAKAALKELDTEDAKVYLPQFDAALKVFSATP